MAYKLDDSRRIWSQSPVRTNPVRTTTQSTHQRNMRRRDGARLDITSSGEQQPITARRTAFSSQVVRIAPIARKDDFPKQTIFPIDELKKSVVLELNSLREKVFYQKIKGEPLENI